MEINATLIGQLITFAVLVWFTMKYVWPPITRAMNEREKKIAAGLAAAEHGKQELKQAAHKAVLIMNEAKRDAAELMEQARKRSLQLIEEAKQTAAQEAERLLQYARSEIDCEVGRAKEALRKQLAPLIVKGAEKIIQHNLTAADQAHLLDQLVAEI